MTEQPQTPENAGEHAEQAPAEEPATEVVPGPAPAPAPEAPASEPTRPLATPPPPPPPPPPAAAAGTADRPEVAVGTAFAGGFLFALILKRLAR